MRKWQCWPPRIGQTTRSKPNRAAPYPPAGLENLLRTTLVRRIGVVPLQSRAISARDHRRAEALRCPTAYSAEETCRKPGAPIDRAQRPRFRANGPDTLVSPTVLQYAASRTAETPGRAAESKRMIRSWREGRTFGA